MTIIGVYLTLILGGYLIKGDDNMNLVIDKEFNELYGVLSTFKIIANYGYFKIQAEEKWNLNLDSDMEKDIKEISENPIFDDARHYVDMELETKDIFINPDFIRISKNLDEYFDYLLDQKEDDFKREILKALELDGTIKNNDESSLNILIEKIDAKKDLNSDIKWYLLSLFKKPRLHIEKFIKLIQDYLPIYQELKNKYMKPYEEFVEWIDEKIDAHGIAFIDDNIEFINLNEYTEVHLNYSLFELHSSHHFSDGTVYIYIGLMFKKYIEDQKDKNDIDKHLLVYKVLSDKTRFDIIQILIKQESYGQEIAEKLGITTATVSYHMDYLLGASLVILKRKSRRIYYSVNKDQIKNSISFLEKELML